MIEKSTVKPHALVFIGQPAANMPLYPPINEETFL
jgi:hypothetical protein